MNSTFIFTVVPFNSVSCFFVNIIYFSLLFQTLYNQFKFFLNMYFLLVATSQFIPQLRIGYLYTYWGPLVKRIIISFILLKCCIFILFSHIYKYYCSYEHQTAQDTTIVPCNNKLPRETNKNPVFASRVQHFSGREQPLTYLLLFIIIIFDNYEYYYNKLLSLLLLSLFFYIST